MLNIEKYIDDILEICEAGADVAVDAETEKPVKCEGQCTEGKCLFGDDDCYGIYKWLAKEYKEKPEMSATDRGFLKSLKESGFKPIPQDGKNPEWKIPPGERMVINYFDSSYNNKLLLCANIKEEESYSIAELLGEKE